MSPRLPKAFPSNELGRAFFVAVLQHVDFATLADRSTVDLCNDFSVYTTVIDALPLPESVWKTRTLMTCDGS